jgi:hypothetical protein
MMEAARYRSTEALSKLERRTTKYQFDLERDVAWPSDDNEHWFPTAFLERLGADMTRLEGRPEARVALEWSLALGACRTFVDLESIVVRFAVEEKASFGEAHSLELLDDEERKHIALFERIGKLLLARRPTWHAPFEEAYRTTAEVNEKQRALQFQRDLYPNEATRHFVFWIGLIFFEEFTIYVEEELAGDASVNKLWRSAHAAHRREEVQHLATDIAYVDALELSAQDREVWSEVLVTAIVRDLHFMTSLDASSRFVALLYPEIGQILQATPPHEARFLKEICQRPEFKRTRAYLPSLKLFA